MPKPKILVTRKIPKNGLDMLREQCSVHMVEKKRPLTKKELYKYSEDKDAVVSMLTDTIDKAYLKAFPNIQIVSNLAVGFNNVDIDAAAKLGVPVTNTPGHLTNTVAEFTVGAILSVARRMGEGERMVRAGKFTGWAPDMLLGHSIMKKTIGLVGAGRIGYAVAGILRHGFGMDILYHDVKKMPPKVEKEHTMKFVPFEKLLSESDIVSVHVPLFPSTRHLIGKKAFSMMKPNAILVNTSRGPVVDEKALVEALKKKKIFGAALDVFEFEPKITAGLKRENVLLTPHIGSNVDTAREEMTGMAVQSVIDYFSGTEPEYIVNPEYVKYRT